MATNAGRYGPELILASAGSSDVVVLLPDTSVRVNEGKSSDTLATLYTDETMSVEAPNPTATTPGGMLSFYAEPGDYNVRAIIDNVLGDRVVVRVLEDPTEDADEDDDALSASTDETITGVHTFVTGIVVGVADGVTVGHQTFPNGEGLHVTANGDADAVGLLLAPGEDVDESGMSSQMILYGKVGDDYNRFAISNVGDAVIIDETFNGDGTPRPISVYIGGSVSNDLTGIEVLRINVNGTLMLNGGAPTIDGEGYSGQTYVADRYDTGVSKLIIGTRTASGDDDPSDSAVIDFDRGNVRKAGIGLNYSGGDDDTIDVVDENGAVLLRIDPAGLFRFARDGIAAPELRIEASTGNTSKLSFHKGGIERGFVSVDTDSNVRVDGDGVEVHLAPNNTIGAKVLDTMADGETALLVRRRVGGSYTLQRVSMGAADSGGSGFKVLRVPN